MKEMTFQKASAPTVPSVLPRSLKRQMQRTGEGKNRGRNDQTLEIEGWGKYGRESRMESEKG